MLYYFPHKVNEPSLQREVEKSLLQLLESAESLCVVVVTAVA